jgi:hypothetical protein
VTLTRQQVVTLVNRYIGVEGGYLGDFSYRTHADFYPEYCDLDIDPNQYEGTTRERFIEILTTQPPHHQARILRGVIARFGATDASDPDRDRLRGELEQWANELEKGPLVGSVTPVTTRGVVLRALSDADALLKASGPISAVDRVHTSLHGHLLTLCEAASIPLPDDASLTTALKRLRREHPLLQATGPRRDDVTKVLFAMASVVDSLNTIRNQASVAHPNEELLDEAEARLAINAGRTIFSYIDEKLSADSRGNQKRG